MWTHGDWVELTDRDTLKITGRSDATLNRDGVRIGTAELYRTLESMPEVSDSLVVCIDRPDGSQHMPLFVVLTQGVALEAVSYTHLTLPTNLRVENTVDTASLHQKT